MPKEQFRFVLQERRHTPETRLNLFKRSLKIETDTRCAFLVEHSTLEDVADYLEIFPRGISTCVSKFFTCMTMFIIHSLADCPEDVLGLVAEKNPTAVRKLEYW